MKNVDSFKSSEVNVKYTKYYENAKEDFNAFTKTKCILYSPLNSCITFEEINIFTFGKKQVKARIL